MIFVLFKVLHFSNCELQENPIDLASWLLIQQLIKIQPAVVGNHISTHTLLLIMVLSVGANYPEEVMIDFLL